MLKENLKKIREEKKYSKVRLAREAGLSTRCIENIEYGKAKSPKMMTLIKIAKVLGVSVDELIK